MPRLPPWWSLEVQAIQEVSSVVSGGVRQRTSNRNLISITSVLDLARATQRTGAGFIGINYQSAPANRGGSQDIGDIQIASNIETDRSLDHILELWYETDLGGGPWRIKVGKTDANGDFAVPVCAAQFSHSSAGFSPTIFPLPTYPESATGIDLFYDVTQDPADPWSLVLSYGLFDGAFGADGVSTGRRGPSSFFRDDLSNDLFHIGQANLGWGRRSDGDDAFLLRVGGWFHDGTFEEVGGGEDRGTGGTFAIAEASPEALEGWTAFAQAAFGDRDVSEFGAHYGLGVVGPSALPEREDDEVGLYWSHVDIPSAFAPSDESAFDLYYRAQLTPHVFVQPELFWVIDPGGREDISDATALFLRVGVAF